MRDSSPRAAFMMRLGRSGFSMAEVIVALAIVALIGGVIMTQVVGRIGGGEAAGVAQNLRNLNAAILEYRTDLGRYPNQLTQLATPPSAGATDLCGNALADPSDWNGPYLSREITSGGIQVGGATIENDLERSPPTYSLSNRYAQLLIHAGGVDRPVAEEIDGSFDGDGNLSTGAIVWTADEGPDRGTLSLVVPIRGC